MNKCSTRCLNELKKKGEEPIQTELSPKKQTLDFLKQFARVYHAESTLCTDLCGYVLN